MKRLLIISLVLFSYNVAIAQSDYTNPILKIGQMLNDSELLPSSNSIEKVIVANDTIWLAASNGLSKSGDDGESWINYGDREEFNHQYTSTVKYHNGIIWAATLDITQLNGEDIGVGTGIKYSKDNGDTWNVIEQPLDNDNDSTVVYGNNVLRALTVTVPEENFIYDMAFTTNTIWIAARAAGLRKSTDMGQTWQRVVLPPDYLDEIHPEDDLDFELSPVAGKLTSETNLNHIVFAVEAIDDNTILVGTSGGLNISEDGGISWRKLNHQNQDQPISGNQVLEIEYDEFSDKLWIVSWKTIDASENWAISSSSDFGETWSVHLPGIKTHGIGFVNTYDGDNITGVDVIAATEKGLFRSDDNGNSWALAPRIIDDNSGLALTTEYFRSVKCKYNFDGSTDIWIGSRNGLVRFKEQGSRWDGDWKIFFASQPLKTQDESYTFPNPFHPGRDVGITRFKYSTSGTAADVTIRIFDFGMNLVRTVIQNATRSLTLNDAPIDYWDGRDDKGRIVPNGAYFYRIDINSNDPLYGKILVVR